MARHTEPELDIFQGRRPAGAATIYFDEDILQDTSLRIERLSAIMGADLDDVLAAIPHATLKAMSVLCPAEAARVNSLLAKLTTFAETPTMLFVFSKWIRTTLMVNRLQDLAYAQTLWQDQIDSGVLRMLDGVKGMAAGVGQTILGSVISLLPVGTVKRQHDSGSARVHRGAQNVISGLTTVGDGLISLETNSPGTYIDVIAAVNHARVVADLALVAIVGPFTTKLPRRHSISNTLHLLAPNIPTTGPAGFIGRGITGTLSTINQHPMTQYLNRFVPGTRWVTNQVTGILEFATDPEANFRLIKQEQHLGCDQPATGSNANNSASTPANSLADAVGVVDGIMPETNEDGSVKADTQSRIRIDSFTDQATGEQTMVVYCPGTFLAGDELNMMDNTSNVTLMRDQTSSSAAAVATAMAAHTAAQPQSASGAPPKVMLVGHSQGGLTAAALASDPNVQANFNVTHVAAFGSPIDEFVIPEHTKVLNVSHKHDPIPALDGLSAANAPNTTYVHAPGPQGHWSQVMTHHRASAYQHTAEQLTSANPDPDLHQFLTGTEQYFSPNPHHVHTHSHYQLTRRPVVREVP